MEIAGRVHAFEFHIPKRSAPPTAAQPAPVMDRYSGLRSASNSFNTSQACRAATKRIAPHADRINTIHRSRVTPKERSFIGMDQVFRNRIRLTRGRSRSVPGQVRVIADKFLAAIPLICPLVVGFKLTFIRQVTKDLDVGKDVIHAHVHKVLSGFPAL